MSIKDLVNEYEFFDQIEEKKLYKDYMQEKEIEFLKYIFLQSVNVDPRELVYENNSKIDVNSLSKNDLIEIIEKNKKKDFENKIDLFTESYLIVMRILVENNGLLELTEKGIENSIDIIVSLRNLGLIFVGSDNEKIIIHIPQDIFAFIYNIFYSEKLKELTNYIEKNTIIYKMIEGMTVAYGNIDFESAFDIIFESYPEISLDKLYRLLFFGSYMLNRAFFIDDNIISYAEQIFDMEFYDENLDIKNFTKEELINLADHKIYSNMDEYNELKHLIKKYVIDNNKVLMYEEKMINIYLFAEQISPDSGNVYLEMNIDKLLNKKIDKVEKFEKLLKGISYKMPKWIYNGFSQEEKEKDSINYKINMKQVYEIKVKIKNSEPVIMRKLQIPYGISLNQLASIIILSFDWSGYSKFAFKIGRTTYYNDISCDNNIMGYTIEDAFENKKNIKFIYNLDDHNHSIIIHEIELQNIYNTDIKLQYPKCIQRKNNIEILNSKSKFDDVIWIKELNMYDAKFFIDNAKKENLSEKNDIEFDELNRINNKIKDYSDFAKWLLIDIKRRKNTTSTNLIKKVYEKYLNMLT